MLFIALKRILWLNINMVIGILVAAAIGFIIWLIQQLITSKTKERSLEQENSNLRQEYETSKKKIVALEEEKSKYTHKQSILSRYSFDKRLGIYKDKNSGDPYCPKCLLLSSPVESPLKVGRAGWYCNSCKTTISNPDYRPSAQEPPSPNYGYGY